MVLVSYYLTFVVFLWFGFACSETPKSEDPKKNSQTVDPYAETTASTPASISGVNLIFAVDDSVEPTSVQGFVVGYPGQLIVEPLSTPTDPNLATKEFIIKDVPPGLHDIVITAGSLAINPSDPSVPATQLSSAKNRGLRLNDIEFTAGANKNLNTLSLPAIGAIRGIAKLQGRREHAGIRVTIDGTHWVSHTDKLGFYSIPEVAVGTQRDIRFHYDAYQDHLIESVTVKSAQETLLDDVTLLPSEGPAGTIKLLKNVNEDASAQTTLSVNVVVNSSDKAVFMRYGSDPDLSRQSWTPVRRTFEYRFIPQYGDPHYKLYYQFKDEDGIDSAVIYESIELSALPPILGENYKGCVAIEALSTSEIKIQFENPSAAEEYFIYRDGVKIFAGQGSSYIDKGLGQGTTYTYSCAARAKNIEAIGKQTFEASTLVSESPVFYGIASAVALDSHRVKVRWGPPTGVPTKLFKILSNPGPLLNWQAEPQIIVESGKYEAIIEGLGDQILYSFGVMACSSPTICDQNRITMQVTTPDDGAPKCSGIASIQQSNGQLLIQAPWTPTQGAVAKRYLYRKIGGAVGITLADYSLDVVVSVAIPHEVPERIARSNIQENVVYHYAIVDEDAKGQRCSLSAPVSYQVNDLTAPTFPGLSLISNDPEALQTAIKLSFTGGKKEADDALLGGSRYVLYQGTGPGNACIAGSRVSTFDMQPFATGQNHVYTVRDLLPRTQYSFCLRTEDSAGNLSVNETSLSLWTLDTTPPAFDGGQDLVYSGSLGEFSVSWNSAEAQDIDHYDLYVWRNKNVPSQHDYFRLQRLAKDFPNGASFGRNEVPFQDEDTIYIKVVACDDADKVPGGISNCSSLQNSVTRSLQIPDVTPPPGFTGVLPASVFEKPGEGALLVKWNLPDNTADYRGFRVFHVNTSAGQRLELLKDCPCPAGSCSNFNSCLLEGLGAYRTYNVHVRAYDAHQNITNYLPAGLYSSVRTSDTTPPLFQSMLILSNKGADVKLSWRQAQDNQDSRDPSATLRYEIYRKLDQTFANQTQPESNLLIKTLDNETSFVDATRKLSGRTYYYTVCALDATSNRNCDGTVGNFAASDTRKPYLDFVDLLDDSGERSWKISWIMNDETTASVDLRVKIDSYYSPVEEFSLNADDYTIPVIFDFGKTSVSNLSPQMGYDGYIHYRISVADAAGNETVRYISRYVGDFRIEVHSVKRNRGLIAGGQTVLIRGYGFDIGSKVYFGNNLCLNTEVLDFDLISCKTPSNPASAVVDVKVVNSLGQSAILTRAFKYYIRVQTSSDHPCDAASKPTTSFQSGSGLESDPYLICTPDQLRLIGELGSATSHYRLGENLVLGNYNEIGGTSSAPWRGTFDADYLSLNTLNESRTIPSGYIEDFALSNLTLRLYRASAFIPGNRTTFKNLRVYGHNLYGGTFLYQFGPSEAVDIKNLRLRNAIVHSGSSNQYFTTFKLDSCSLRFDSSGGQTSLIGEEVRIENCSIVSRQSTASVSIGGSKTFMSNIFIDSNNNGGISLLSAGSIQSVFNGISVLARHNDCERSGAKPLSTGLIGTMDNISLVLRSYDKGACSAEYDNYGHFPNQIMRTSLIKANYVTNYRLFLSTSPSTSLENSIVKLSINAVDGGRMYSSFADCQNVLFEGQIFYDTNTKFAGLCRNVTDSLSNIGMNTPPLSIFSSMGSSSNIRGIYRGEVYQPTNVPGAFGSASSPNSYWDTDSTNIPASPGQIQGGGLQPADFANDAYFADYDFENIWQWNEDHTQPILRFKTWDFVNVWKKDPTGGVDHKLRMNSFDFVQTWRLGPGGELLLRHQDAPNVWP